MSVNYGPKRTEQPFNEVVFDEIVEDELVVQGPVVAGSLTIVPPNGSFAALLQGNAALPTPTGIINGEAWDFGGVGYHIGQFGARFDGVTDDTVAWQDFADFITNKSSGGKVAAGFGARGLLSPGISIVSSAGAGTPCVNFSSRPGWWVQGSGSMATVVRCATDNAPIFYISADAVSMCHHYGLDGFQFDYVNSQPSTNTTANPIVFGGGLSNQGCNQGSLTNLDFNRGSYGIAVAAGALQPWGQHWDNLTFGNGITIGAYSGVGSGASACPNNNWGRILCAATNMIGPIFNQVRGYNFVIGNIEVFSNFNNAQLFVFSTGGSQQDVHIGALKCEGLTATTLTVGTPLISVIGAGRMHIGQLFIGGSPCTATGAGVVVLIALLGNSASLDIDYLDLGAITLSGGALAYVAQLNPALSQMTIGYLTPAVPPGGWLLCNAISNSSQDGLTILSWVRGFQSQNLGDVNYAIAPGQGQPNTLNFETAWSAQRTITLPGTDATVGNLFNGLKYRIRFYGTGIVFPALIVCNGVTLYTQTADKTAVEFTYRKTSPHPQNGWVMTGFGTLP